MAKNAATATPPEAPAEVKEAAEVKVPADPRARLLKKFHGKFLPKGILRERFKSILERWNSGPDHGNVTLDEIKAVLADWKGTREKPPRLPKA